MNGQDDEQEKTCSYIPMFLAIFVGFCAGFFAAVALLNPTEGDLNYSNVYLIETTNEGLVPNLNETTNEGLVPNLIETTNLTLTSNVSVSPNSSIPCDSTSDMSDITPDFFVRCDAQNDLSDLDKGLPHCSDCYTHQELFHESAIEWMTMYLQIHLAHFLEKKEYCHREKNSRRMLLFTTDEYKVALRQAPICIKYKFPSKPVCRCSFRKPIEFCDFFHTDINFFKVGDSTINYMMETLAMHCPTPGTKLVNATVGIFNYGLHFMNLGKARAGEYGASVAGYRKYLFPLAQKFEAEYTHAVFMTNHAICAEKYEGEYKQFFSIPQCVLSKSDY